MQNFTEKEKANEDRTKEKKEWKKPDIFIYPVTETMADLSGADDGSCIS